MSRRRATSCRWPGWRCRTSSPPRSAWRSRSRSSAGFARRSTGDLGNFWVDLVRGALRILLPLSRRSARSCSIAGGVIQNFDLHDQVVTTLAGAQQTIPGGPVASQEAIKELGTNGGGFYNANSAHPFENPTDVDQLDRDLPAAGDRVLAAAHVRPDGRAARKQGYAIVAVMACSP